MSDKFPVVKVAAVQASPIFLNREETIEKVERLVKEAAAKGAKLVAFGESFIPGFPIWTNVLRPIDQHRLYVELYNNAVEIPSPAFDRLLEIARENKVYLSIGITEKSKYSPGTMWNTNLLIGPDGKLLNRHRKLVPTWAEKLVWAPGDGSGLRVIETEVGRVGVLICGENTNTLARFALLAQGEQVHVATYPPAWPFARTKQSEYNLTEAIRIRAAAHSFEGKVFTVVASDALDEEAIKRTCGEDAECRKLLEEAPPPVSMVIGPSGN